MRDETKKGKVKGQKSGEKRKIKEGRKRREEKKKKQKKNKEDNCAVFIGQWQK